MKVCTICRQEKNLDRFSPTKKNEDGSVRYRHSQCTNARFKSDPTTAREATAQYRLRHPERWRAAHRLHQYKRRAKIEATSDGTVTDEFLKELYSRVECFWCHKFTEEVDRTLEHVVELNDGGSHSIHNIEMACRSCNSARLGRKQI